MFGMSFWQVLFHVHSFSSLKFPVLSLPNVILAGRKLSILVNVSEKTFPRYLVTQTQLSVVRAGKKIDREEDSRKKERKKKQEKKTEHIWGREG